ncbi:MAG: hypothetical protein COS14_11235 [Bacteroidetes bacterium CG02_land_8_20_14_3_00_31_25]|nr:hypothetical protein [Bacteroidota bacterium]PIV58128.1 MAG: hypothetical protein COS14_11235 [Bacteroidetes bacterium CG02_land_8_20_14_3_00_31_25]PIX36238.1 MAG: hypothetical protein COZ59_02175 [Bacteroidetes bacterium CG_4_8_14_3_um_filter_31_14]PIY03982.1 MAG: hypothetical protein COZ21_07800 [Bacteroidetes bacterium CG_4_10_14_3_um_filter_31_20]
MKKYLNDNPLPFCKGCGHSLISENTEKALNNLGIKPLDVILVTDIGCHGIIDKAFQTHTVHGLHGRSVALASGVSAGLNNPDKKVLVFLGDGGATIGMQHIINAAHYNYNMTVVIHNNFLYGMTGGQPSEFTPLGFKTPTLSEGADHSNYDICKIVAAAGANYVRRIIGIGDFSEQLTEAFSVKGFSLIEIIEICTSYAVKANPGMKLGKVAEEAGLVAKLYINEDKKAFVTKINNSHKSLMEQVNLIEAKYKSKINKPVRIMISGSAGEGVQVAAELLAKTAIISGLNSTKKGSYPVTVGVGFSSSEVIISPEPIKYTGFSSPEILFITSQDGLNYAKATICKMTENDCIYLDESLNIQNTKAKIIKHDFRNKAGNKFASIYALLYYINSSEVFPKEAFYDTFVQNMKNSKVDITTLLN